MFLMLVVLGAEILFRQRLPVFLFEWIQTGVGEGASRSARLRLSKCWNNMG